MNDITFLKDGEYTTFRGKPIIRDNNVICYGDMQKDAYVLLLMVIKPKTITLTDGTTQEIPDKIMGQIYSTDTALDATKRVEKMFQAGSLFEALDLGTDYLDRANQKGK